MNKLKSGDVVIHVNYLCELVVMSVNGDYATCYNDATGWTKTYKVNDLFLPTSVSRYAAGCECGAMFTSNKNFHYRWCPLG